ncbi:rhodanese-like domain-containing protein [Gordonia sp. (in: high G+C Gram-positive bacteria)]|uniref:rhodanese-like domain-containing protein n=1 Tax=Gordonia sp. (in: high G+C Gram-positive bacteria) TaxID=84139 RepID=UPI0016904280|nr:rhodanese-like domain-containing protein [Gordonia sp. (in: high G+C Gram-positive bacteria)]NLG47591.1 rhodanese-like domain-containing protein [Gordonia sp. (in: high G+C Gram-positive bacteria)]
MTLAFSAPVTTSYSDTPLSLQADQYRAATAAGAVAVDLRDAHSRAAGGALIGAVALDIQTALELLDPDSHARLRGATSDARWVLISDDGYDAEMLAWHLQARGVRGARFVVGGHAALRAARVNGSVGDDALGLFDTH